MKTFVLLVILPLAGCGFTSVQASLTPSSVAGQPPTMAIKYWSSKQQTWVTTYDPQTHALALSVKANTETGWGAEDVSKVISATGASVGAGVGTALKAYTGKP